MRAGTILAVVLLLAACAGAPTSAPSPEPTPAETVRILASDLSGDYPNVFAVDAATDPDQYDTLWTRVGQDEPQPAVDFQRELVLYLGMAGSSSCPERFEALVVDAQFPDEPAHVYAQWAEQDPDQPCTDDLAPQGLLLAVDRSGLPAEPFLLSLRQQPICPDCPDFGDQLTVDPR